MLESLKVFLMGCPLLPQRGLRLPLSLRQLLGHQLLVQGCLLFGGCDLLPQARQLPCTRGWQEDRAESQPPSGTTDLGHRSHMGKS